MARGLDVAFRLEGDPLRVDEVAEAAGNLVAAEVGTARKEKLEWRIFRIDQLDGGRHYRLAVRHPARVFDIGLEGQLRQQLAHRCTEPPEALLEEYARARQAGLEAVPIRAVPETVDYWADPLWVRMGTVPPPDRP